MKEYKGIPYIVTHGPIGSPVAYVRIPDNHKWNKLVDKTEVLDILPSKPEVHNGYDDIDIDVHGGLTFSRSIGDELWPQQFTPGAWIGWDYAHAGDKTRLWSDGYEWTLEEAEKDCFNVIDQLLEAAS